MNSDELPAGQDRPSCEDWDANDERRRKDTFAPPAKLCECWCLHCRRTFMSDQIWFQRIKGARDGIDGFWMCPTPNCDGAGFTFDIFPTDPNHPANEGWCDFDESSDEEEGESDPESDEIEFDAFEDDDSEEFEFEPEPQAEWNPEELEFKELDEIFDPEDLEGEEWKYGLEPGEQPKVEAPPPGVEPKSWAEEEALYNEPDRRPRELDWSDRETGKFVDGEDDVPF